MLFVFSFFGFFRIMLFFRFLYFRLLVFSFFTYPIYAKIIGTVGKTYPIAEPDAGSLVIAVVSSFH
jgi:hypothetical protein